MNKNDPCAIRRPNRLAGIGGDLSPSAAVSPYDVEVDRAGVAELRKRDPRAVGRPGRLEGGERNRERGGDGDQCDHGRKRKAESLKKRFALGQVAQMIMNAAQAFATAINASRARAR